MKRSFLNFGMIPGGAMLSESSSIFEVLRKRSEPDVDNDDDRSVNPVITTDTEANQNPQIADLANALRGLIYAPLSDEFIDQHDSIDSTDSLSAVLIDLMDMITSASNTTASLIARTTTSYQRVACGNTIADIIAPYTKTILMNKEAIISSGQQYAKVSVLNPDEGTQNVAVITELARMVKDSFEDGKVAIIDIDTLNSIRQQCEMTPIGYGSIKDLFDALTSNDAPFYEAVPSSDFNLDVMQYLDSVSKPTPVPDIINLGEAIFELQSKTIRKLMQYTYELMTNLDDAMQEHRYKDAITFIVSVLVNVLEVVGFYVLYLAVLCSNECAVNSAVASHMQMLAQQYSGNSSSAEEP